jgi:hypothetical protein
MKPFTSGTVIAAWLLRLVIVFFVYYNYFHSFTDFDLKSFGFYISGCYCLFALLLLAGGLSQNETLTVISGLGIFVLPVIQLIREFPRDILDNMLIYLVPLAVGFAFFSFGNNK